MLGKGSALSAQSQGSRLKYSAAVMPSRLMGLTEMVEPLSGGRVAASTRCSFFALATTWASSILPSLVSYQPTACADLASTTT